jgi:photosystem II stability/assembly factor-like uncharacterized protein
MLFMRRIRYIVLVAVLVAANLAQTTPSYGQTTSYLPYVRIRDFHLVSSTEGWVWTDHLSWTRDSGETRTDHLSWTRDSGQTWTDITPNDLNGGGMAAVAFADNQHGSVIAITSEPGTWHAAYLIAQTTDGGRTWETRPLNASLTWEPGDMSLQFLDVHTGWLRVREAHNTNYDIGQLVKTTDGGATWTALQMPGNGWDRSIGDPVYFVTDQVGWIAGRWMGSDNLLYHTQDGGHTWQTTKVGVAPFVVSERYYQLPQFVNVQDGLLTVEDRNGLSYMLEVYVTHNGGRTWQFDTMLANSRLVKMLDSTHWIAVVNGLGLVRRTIGRILTALNQDPSLAAITDMDFVSPTTGLALLSLQICPPNAKPGECIPQNYLLYTSSGGQTSQPLAVPNITTS